MKRKEWQIIDSAENIVDVIKANSADEALDLWRKRHPAYASDVVRVEAK